MGIEIFSLQLLHRKFEISVCGMFICDNTLLYTVKTLHCMNNVM